MNRPMVYPRREKKAYGTGRMVEGKFEKGERVVVLDDVITTGTSKVEAIEPLVNAGLQVQDVVVLIDREQGGSAELAARGYRVHAVMKISEIVEYLLKAGQISDEQYHEVMTLVHGAS